MLIIISIGLISLGQSKKIVKSDRELVDGLEVLQIPPEQNKLEFWKEKLQEEPYQESRPAKAKITYNIAKSFARIDLDSAEVYAQKALQILNEQDDFSDIETAIYNGLGNIANARGQIYQATYFYNKVVAIMDTKESAKIPIKNKISFYLHSAQANTSTRQMKKAYQQNVRAKALLNQLSEEKSYLPFRVYSQLFNCHLKMDAEVDSMKYYLDLVEKNVTTASDSRFFWEHKAHYFSQVEENDSSLYYIQKTLNADLQFIESNPTQMELLMNAYIGYNNLIIAYSKEGDTRNAKKYVDKAKQFRKKYNAEIFSDDTEILHREAMVSYYDATNQIEEYKREAMTWIRQKTKFYERNQLQALEEMNALYQLEAKDKSIQNLNTAMHLKSNQLRNTQFWLVILALLTALTILLSRMFLARKRNEQLQREHENVLLQQKLLRTQMEPHFIFNILSSLQSMIRFDEKEKSIKYINQFSRLLRNSLELSRQNLVPLGDEIETLKSYLSLQAMRFDNSFVYSIRIDPEIDLEDVFVPPMLIQPFVENSIKHGFVGEDKDWSIRINVSETAENLIEIVIEDNGIGLQKDTKESKSHRSLSGAIAKERLQLLSEDYSENATYSMKSTDEGTTITLVLPSRLSYN